MSEAKTSRRPVIERYRPQEIEKKWQARWDADGIYHTDLSAKRKRYFLTMLPYTSGDLHVGHWYAMAPSDAAARYHRMRGHEVFFPFGFAASGLPAGTAALSQGITQQNGTTRKFRPGAGKL